MEGQAINESRFELEWTTGQPYLYWNLPLQNQPESKRAAALYLPYWFWIVRLGESVLTTGTRQNPPQPSWGDSVETADDFELSTVPARQTVLVCVFESTSVSAEDGVVYGTQTWTEAKDAADRRSSRGGGLTVVAG